MEKLSLRPDEITMISVSLVCLKRNALERLRIEKLPAERKVLSYAVIAADCAAQGILSNATTSEHVKTMCGALEATRRLTSKDTRLDAGQKHVVMSQCSELIEKLSRCF
jgi:hypothetical protein